MLSREARANALNLVEAMRFFGRGRKDASVRDCPGLSLISCGLNYAAFNAAMFQPSVMEAPRELTERIENSAAYFAKLHVRWTCWVCEDCLEPAVRQKARSSFQRLGLNQLTETPGLYADALLGPRRALPELQVRRVENEATRRAFAHITSLAFELPQDVCWQIYGSETAWQGSFEGYVGYSNGYPVTTAAVVVTDDVAGLYSVGTLPNSRRVGYAEAIMRAALKSVKQRTGIEATVLQSSTSGLSLYERMGYRKTTRFSVYIS